MSGAAARTGNLMEKGEIHYRKKGGVGLYKKQTKNNKAKTCVYRITGINRNMETRKL